MKAGRKMDIRTLPLIRRAFGDTALSGINRASANYWDTDTNPDGSREISGKIQVKTENQLARLVRAIVEASSANGFQITLRIETGLNFSSARITKAQEKSFISAVAAAGFDIDNHAFYGTEHGPFNSPKIYLISSPRPEELPKRFEGYSINEAPNFWPNAAQLSAYNQTLSHKEESPGIAAPQAA